MSTDAPVIKSPEIIRRKRPTTEDHLQHYDDLLSYLAQEIDRKSRSMEPGVRTLRKARKKLLNMKKELPKIRFTKKAFAPLTKREPIGLLTPVYISIELAKFLHLPEVSLISRLDAIRALCVYCHLDPEESREEMKRWSYLNTNGRNLQDPQDRRYILPDKELSKLLRYDEYRKAVEGGKMYRTKKDKETGEITTEKVTSARLSYLIIQKLLSVHFLVENEDDEESE